jgi:hypothetical protein
MVGEGGNLCYNGVSCGRKWLARRANDNAKHTSDEFSVSRGYDCRNPHISQRSFRALFGGIREHSAVGCPLRILPELGALL